jgi:hypothetical protein
MLHRARTSALIGAVAMVGGLVWAPAAVAETTGAQGCPPDVWYKVVTHKPSYETIGKTAGKYNASPTTSRLTYEKSSTTTKETSWGAELGGSVNWGIAEVEYKTDYSVVKKFEKGTKVTNWMNVPGKHSGYTTPKIQRRKFTIEKWQDTASCGARFVGNMGVLKGITVAPFFSECTIGGARECTPKP